LKGVFGVSAIDLQWLSCVGETQRLQLPKVVFENCNSKGKILSFFPLLPTPRVCFLKLNTEY
jgi:hypothetical protein